MITKDEFLALYEKYMSGQCTADEKKLLDTYRDEMTLADEGWDDDQVREEDVRTRIWQRLNDNRKVVQLPRRKVARYRWLQVAAVFVAVLFAGIFFIQRKKNHETGTVKLTNKVQPPILPGGNKAYLTLANGSRIVLDDAKNGKLATRPGVTVSKTGNGMLVYHFTNTNNNTAATPEFNTITTPRGGQYQVVLEDGTRVWLNAASSIKFPQAFTGATREVELSGEAYFEVAKNKAKPFIVQANSTKVQVFGTHFNINAYGDNNNVTTTLLEGSVQMSSGASAVMLAPGQQGNAVNGAAIKVSPADIQQTMAWKNGLFIFHDLNITEVMKQVGRWYDVDVEYRDEEVKKNEFGGTISKYKSINELLDVMVLTRSIHYKIEGRRVIIMK
ncbi:FecR family protein [Mucilaginibacter sp. SG564]|uniref:FecR family protein n=1 Tax=Mucilaginibacter sp. SG564 TaxID=2587022 RepID=UPI001553C1EE|nr:FecR family protein [Mucilaginibacter sp. SG564]NOW99029.1 ferric-dicitrate binding protein FerR (iron transport regulator) [Mucilaginibacter sp. SG564]